MISGEQFGSHEERVAAWDRNVAAGKEARPPGLGAGRVRDFEEPELSRRNEYAGLAREAEPGEELPDPPDEITLPGFRSRPAAPPAHSEEEGHGQLSLFPAAHYADPNHFTGRHHEPPPGYYKQSPNEQMVLPGMEMSPHEHAAAGGFSYSAGPNWHHLSGALSMLDWAAEEPGVGSKPGEIGLVESRQRGDAARIHAVARRIASEHASVAFPRHSPNRTNAGAEWVEKEQKKYGEEVW